MMYKLAYIKVDDYCDDCFLKILNQLGCVIEFTEKEDAEKKLQDIRGLFIFDVNGEFLHTISEWIQLIRPHKEVSIWLISKKITTFHRLAYLKLGVDGVFDETDSLEIRRLIVSNYLDRMERVLCDTFRKEEMNHPSENKISINHQNRTLSMGEKGPIELTNLEYQVMRLLINKKNQIVVYKELYEQIWQDEDYTNASYRLANLIFHIRQKLRKHSISDKYLRTVSSKGYMLKEKE